MVLKDFQNNEVVLSLLKVDGFDLSDEKLKELIVSISAIAPDLSTNHLYAQKMLAIILSPLLKEDRIHETFEEMTADLEFSQRYKKYRDKLRAISDKCFGIVSMLFPNHCTFIYFYFLAAL